jgi:large subunit ribosomal protein L6
MSRIGRKAIPLSDKVKVTIKDRHVLVEGPLGKQEILLPLGVTVKIENNIIHVGAPAATRGNRGFQGMVRAILANHVHGVLHGFERTLDIQGVGYKAELKGDKLVLALGFSHAVEVKVPKSLKVVVDKNQTKLSVKGSNKQEVYQFAARVRSYKPAAQDPYKVKGVKYDKIVDAQGHIIKPAEEIKRKAGKTGAK